MVGDPSIRGKKRKKSAIITCSAGLFLNWHILYRIACICQAADGLSYRLLQLLSDICILYKENIELHSGTCTFCTLFATVCFSACSHAPLPSADYLAVTTAY